MRWLSTLAVALLPAMVTAAGAQTPGKTMAPDWRQQMIARGADTLSVDQALANLTRNLDLTSDQVAKIRPILQAHHDRILAILKSAPASLTHGQFMEQVHAISAQTHDQVNALLTPRQVELVKSLGAPARIETKPPVAPTGRE
jgi:Spy/CpxP family protein refolding chaperone